MEAIWAIILPLALSLVAVNGKQVPSYEVPGLDRLASPELQTFENDQDFRTYLRKVKEIERKVDGRPYRRIGAASSVPYSLGAAAQDGVPCTDPLLCPDEDSGDQAMIVTGSRVAPPSITNNQVVGVDEGDIVKRIGNYLLVLEDGRIFAIHFPTMRLTERIDVYRRDEHGEPTGADWYDEMLVQGNQVIITAYSYEDEASEISVFRLDEKSGKLERRGVFLISSEDYYDVDNYATRVVGDRLVVYTPYDAEQIASRGNRPVVRRWQPGEKWEDAVAKGKQLLDAGDIYRPVFGVLRPYVHSVSICPLGNVAAKGLDCRSTAFVAPDKVTMFVSPDSVYLWASAASDEDDFSSDCERTGRAKAANVPPAAVFRIPMGGGYPSVAGALGLPFDQFSMDQADGRFRALVGWPDIRCDIWEYPMDAALYDAGPSAFGSVYRPASPGLFTALPSPGVRMIENRFSEGWLVYGGRAGYGSYPPDPDDEDERGPYPSAIAVPLKDPEHPVRINQGHNVIRIERVGNDILMTGYFDDRGLTLSYLKLGRDARLASQQTLTERYESEGRSHAFNSTMGASGAGILGVPTVKSDRESGRWWWWSRVSDLSFLTFDQQGRLADAGFLPGKAEDDTKTADGYSCEVSCIDWYGNARPIFIDNAIYGLVATELVEARVEGGQVRPLRRLDLTGPVAR